MSTQWDDGGFWDSGLSWDGQNPLPPAPGFAPNALLAGLPTGSVEIAMTNLGWGGTMLMTPTGDVQLIADVPSIAPATKQRIYRLMLTSCMVFDAQKNPISCADDLFNVNWGVGLRQRVGQMYDSTFVNQVTNQCLAALAADPGIAQNPAPTVLVQYVGGGQATVNVTCNTITGTQVVIPTVTIRVS